MICTDISRERAAATAQALNAKGYNVRAEGLDVTDSAAIDALAAALPPLDVLVCNAGIVTHTPAEEMTDADWDKVIAVNLTGVFRTCRGFGRRMLEAGRGSIINIGSISGQSLMCRSLSATTMHRGGSTPFDQITGGGVGHTWRSRQCRRPHLYRNTTDTRVDQPAGAGIAMARYDPHGAVRQPP